MAHCEACHPAEFQTCTAEAPNELLARELWLDQEKPEVRPFQTAVDKPGTEKQSFRLRKNGRQLARPSYNTICLPLFLLSFVVPSGRCKVNRWSLIAALMLLVLVGCMGVESPSTSAPANPTEDSVPQASIEQTVRDNQRFTKQVETVVIQRHEHNREFAALRVDEWREQLPKTWVPERARPDDLSTLDSLLEMYTGCLGAVEPQADQLPDLLGMRARAIAAMFALAESGGNGLEAEIGPGPAVRLEGRVDESALHVGRWLDGFWLAAIRRDAKSLEMLNTTTSSRLRDSSTQMDDYAYLLMDALQLHSRADPRAAMVLDAALSSAREDATVDPARTRHLAVPAIEVLLAALQSEKDFNSKLSSALEMHKKYWSKGKRKDQSEGMMSIPLLGVCSLAHERGVDVRVESDYVPGHLVRGLQLILAAIRRGDVEAAEGLRDRVCQADLQQLIDTYEELDRWIQKVTLVFIIQDIDDPRLDPVMRDALHVPDTDSDAALFVRAIALCHLQRDRKLFARYVNDYDFAKSEAKRLAAQQ